jgi:hypothetical protein
MSVTGVRYALATSGDSADAVDGGARDESGIRPESSRERLARASWVRARERER